MNTKKTCQSAIRIEVNHIRRRLIFPLLGTQILGAICLLVFFNLDSYRRTDSQQQLIFIVSATIAMSAVCLLFLALILRAMISPWYFIMYENGEAVFRPFFFIIKFKWNKTVNVQHENSTLTFDQHPVVSEQSNKSVRSSYLIKLPSTVDVIHGPENI